MFGNLQGFIAVNVIAFSPGTIVVSYEILTDSSSSLTSSVANQLLQQVDNTGFFRISTIDGGQGIFFYSFSARGRGRDRKVCSQARLDVVKQRI